MVLVHKRNWGVTVFIGACFLVCISFFAPHVTTAAPTPQLTYHGKLTDTNNIPVADGTYTFTLSIYDAPTNGNCLWTARGDCTTKQAKTLTITKGIFHTTLGETGDNPLTLDFNQDYYLEIQIGTNTPMTPRRTITPTGSAINAERLNGKTADNYINTTDNQTKAGTLTLQNNLTLNSTLTDNTGSTGALDQVLAIREGGVVRWNNIGQLIDTLAFMVGGNYTASPAIFGTKNNYDVVFQTNNTEQMRLLANGNLGIGTAAPTERLGINGNIDFQSPITVPARPTAALNDVAGNLNGSYAYRVTYVDAQGRQTEVSLNSAYISTVNQQMIVTIPVSADPRVMARKIYRNKANAAVGPWHLVTTVNDNTTTTYNDNIADTALPNTYGPSINTTAGTLYVNGMPFLSAATSSTAVGFRALQNNGGIGSTGFGYQALFSNTGNDASGFGLNALFANTGSYVAAFGASALQNNIVSYASGFGYAALQNNTGGTASGFGYSALQNNTGGDSSGFGYQALQDNSGLYSSGFGYQALRTNTGNYAAGFGYRALSSNTAANSTGFGYVSLQRNKGLNSTGVGAFALQDNQGNESAGVGFMALQNNTGGISVGIGPYALQYNTAATAIGIGHFSLRYNTGGYSFGIGNNALYSNTGTNAYGFGSSALAQNIGGGAIGIGYNALQINTGLNATGLGNYTLQNNTGAYAVGIGYATLSYNQGDNNIAIGRAAFNNFNENTAAEKIFAPTDIDITTERITITAHGFGADNTYINLRFKTTGTAPGGLTPNAIYQFKIIDANTLETAQGSQKMDLTSQGAGTHTLTPQHVYSNSIAIGYDTEPTASNQIMMGNNATTELVPGSSNNTSLGSPTRKWKDLHLGGAIYDSTGSPGTHNQILISTATGIQWTSASALGLGTFLSLTDTPNTYTAGSIYFADATNITEDNTNFFWDNANKRLGIGTNTPTQSLSTTGGIAFNGRMLVGVTSSLGVTAGGTAVGFGSMQNSVATGATAVGISALSSNTGNNATGVGYVALVYNMGHSATGIGHSALQGNTGAYAVGVGRNALYSNSGTDTIGIGYNTLQYNHGNGNIAIGSLAFNNFIANTSAAKTFAPQDVSSTNDTITITGHGFGATDTYITMRLTSTGTLMNGAPNNTILQFRILDANTIQVVDGVRVTDITSQGTCPGGLADPCHTITPQTTLSNSIAIGYDTEPTASNQIMMGNNATTELISGADGTVNLGSATHRWNTVYATNGTINTSDITQKKNINTLTYGLNEILAINPISFHWKNDEFGTKTKIGFSAQELQHIIPEVVSQGKDNTLGIYYADLIPVAFNAIKQQQQLIHTNTNTITQHTGILQKVQSDITAQNTKADHITHIQKLQTDILTLKQDTQNYHTVIDDLKLQLEQAQAGIDLLTAMSTQQTTDLTALLAIDPGRIVMRDTITNPDGTATLAPTITLAGITVSADRVEAREVATGKMVVMRDTETNTVGTVTLCPAQMIADADGVCQKVDAQDADGMHATVVTDGITESAAIFTSVENHAGATWVAKERDAKGHYTGFTVHVAAPVMESVVVRWWIVGVEEK